MILSDVNLYVYAHRADSERHDEARAWLTQSLAGPQPYAYTPSVVTGFIRIVTHPRVFRSPSSLGDAWTFARQITDRPNATLVLPGARHLALVEQLCRQGGAKGNLVPDAALAAVAVENGCRLASTDGDFGRFADLEWENPLT